jgi:hypothetical protein
LILLISHDHTLLPIAYRLSKEGEEVKVFVVRERFRRCWAGLPLTFVAEEEEVLKLAGGSVVLTNSDDWATRLAGHPRLFPTIRREEGNIYYGAWWDDGWSGVHLLLEARGAWTGGQGPQIAGASVLIRSADLPYGHSVLAAVEDEVKASGARGLVKVSVTLDLGAPGKEPNVLGWSLGWGALHPHVLLAQLAGAPADLAAVLGGAQVELPHRYAVAGPVSLPPWPILCNINAPRVKLSPEAAGLRNVMFHDVARGGDGIYTAGTDGLVGVVWGVGPHFVSARATAFGAAFALRQSLGAETQFRSDNGDGVQQMLGILADLGLTY